MTQQVQTYRERSRAFLVKARDELLAGDLEQASEKPWGAAGLIVKAVADRRGMEHQKHHHLFRVVDALVRETGDRHMDTLFAAANGFHINFYEDWFTASQVERRLDDVSDFVARLERL